MRFLKYFQVNKQLLDFDVKGPIAMPPIKDYDSPDGEYTDTT